MKNTVIAIDLAKNIFQVAVSRRLGVVAEHHRLSRPRLLPFFAEHQPAQLRKRLAEIEEKADALLEGLSEATRGFIDSELRDLGVEQRRLQRRLEELESVPYTPIDADAVLKQGLVALDDLPRLMASGSLEERKEFMHAFVAGITVHPDEERLDVLMRKIPAMALPQPGDSSVGMVAGAGFEPATFGL